MRTALGQFLRAGRRVRFISISALILLLLYYFLDVGSIDWASESERASPAQNQTLGFGAIYVLTEDTATWRVQGLRKAAQLTGIRLTIPVQPHLSDEDVLDHLAGDEPVTKMDEIRALLNYVALLEVFLQSGYETALFFEDDVDFGVDIRSQMERISETILSHISEQSESETDSESDKSLIEYPYGGGWDVFWLGHFGVEYTQETNIWFYEDPYALPWTHLSTDFNNYFEEQVKTSEHFGAQPQQILIRATAMATYAFALSRAGAEKIIQTIRNDRAQRFDLTLHMDCKGLKLHCLAPVPEVMHHHHVDGERSLGEGETKEDRKHDLKWWRTRHKYTYNIEWSARCNAAGVGENLGERWQCMPGKYDWRI